MNDTDSSPVVTEDTRPEDEGRSLGEMRGSTVISTVAGPLIPRRKTVGTNQEFVS